MLYPLANRTIRLSLTSLVLLGFILLGLSQSVVATQPVQAAGRPNTIPALREWTDGAGSYTFSAASRIMYNGTGLAGDAATFSQDLLAMTGLNIPTLNGTSPAAGDIYLTLGATDTAIGDEGYLLTIGNSVTISARANAGAFYGTRTMLQLIKQGFTIAAGSARDWPMYKLRGIMVDNGRRYYTPAWLRDHVRELSYVKLNFYHWHISDREGFGIESTSHPEAPTAPFLTKAEVTAIINLATQYHITIMPEIDSPAHLTAALRTHPELWLNGSDPGEIDLATLASYTFMTDLYEEYLALFPGPYFGIGADEAKVTGGQRYIDYAQANFCPPNTTANVYDALVGWVNYFNDVIRAHGKTGWHWNDPVDRVVPSCHIVDSTTVVDHWLGDPTTSSLPQGHFIFNSNRWMTYTESNASEIYKWNPAVYATTLPDAHPMNLGGNGLHIWGDRANGTEADIAIMAYEKIRSTGQVTWNSPKITTQWNAFKAIINTLGRSPGYGEHLGGGNPTATPTRTNTPTGPTATPTRTNTPAPPTNTPTVGPSPTHTNTPTGPTNTPTSTLTRTNTPVPPTNTPTRTNTLTGPTATPSANLALGKTTTVSSFHTAEKTGAAAVDGSTSTFWRTLKGSTLASEWIVVDLGSSFTIDSVTLKWGQQFAKNYTIQVSPDNSNWTTVYSITNENGGIDTITFAPASARYVKMDSTLWNNIEERNYLQEFEIYQ